MTTLQLNRLHHPVTTLGYGTRAGIWVQGCTIGCASCASRDTWAVTAGTVVQPADIVSWLDTLPTPIDGVTISGGEPFQQPEALGELLAALVEWRAGRVTAVDLLVFSGYPWSRLAKTTKFASILKGCDAVVAGPYVARRNTGSPLRGSDNQLIVTLTKLGQDRYGQPATLPPPRMQVAVNGDGIYLIGIPRRGDLDRMRSRLAERGIALESVTWQA